MRLSRPSVFTLIALVCTGLCSAQVPPVYQDLYTQLTTDVTDFQKAITSSWDGSTHSIDFAGQLTVANSNNGPQLLSGMPLIQSEILFLKSVGAKAVSVEVSFPMLNPTFLNGANSSYQSQFASFYGSVADFIHAQGMKVIVESQSMIPSGLQSQNWPTLPAFYASLTFPAYMAARAQTAAIVAQTMHPDYFVLQEEPDTEASQSGQSEAGTVTGSTMMLAGSLAAVRAANVSGVKLGAGFGSWLQAFPDFANSFTQQPLDFLDMHVFPIMEQTKSCSPSGKPCAFPNFWQNALTILSTARAANKPMTISQCWLRKARDTEWPPVGGLGDVEEAREAYSFWQPLDLAFLQTIYDLANYGQMDFVVPFNTQNYSSYLTWSGGSPTCAIPSCTAIQGEGGGNTPSLVFGEVQKDALSNLNIGSGTDVGIGYQSLIVPAKVLEIKSATAGQIEPFAAESLVAGYGVDLAASPVGATSLTTSLGGTTVNVTDSAGTTRPAYVFYVSPGQVNYEIPKDSALGPALANIHSQNANQIVAIQIGAISPGIFMLNTSGLAAALVDIGGSQVHPKIYQVDSSNNILALPLALTSSEQFYLELYGTGIRASTNVMVTVGGLNVPVIFVGPAPGYEGLDQVNIGPLPSSLAGRGSVDIILTANDQPANTVSVTFK